MPRAPAPTTQALTTASYVVTLTSHQGRKNPSHTPRTCSLGRGRGYLAGYLGRFPQADLRLTHSLL